MSRAPARPLRVALAQINATVGDIDGNAAHDRRARSTRARDAGAELVVFPELARHRLPARGPAAEGALPARRARRRSSELAADAQGIVALVGFPERAEDVYNALAVLADGAVQGDLPQDVPAELRRLRRAALLPGRRRAAR